MTDMQEFDGFPPGKTHTIKIPTLFFSELLGAIDDLAELKLTLYCFWVLQQQEGQYRYVRFREVVSDTLFMQGISGISGSSDTGSTLGNAEETVRRAFERATTRGTLLHVTVESAQGPEDLYFMNTAHGRNAVRAIEAGEYVPGDRDTPVELVIDRPNIFLLYEQNIGPLTPMIGEQLRHAEDDYPAAWIEEAIQLAVENNKRSWKYVEAILKRWQAEGKDSGRTQQPTQADRYRYIKGEFSDFVDY